MDIALSIVIPAFNEAQRIGQTLSDILSYVERFDLPVEILVIDDGSTDDTAEMTMEAAGGDNRVSVIPCRINKGKGAAVRTGVMESSGARVLISDADLSTPITELPLLQERLDAGADIAIGSRGMAGAQLVRRQPALRELAGRAGNLVIRTLCPSLWGITDTQCGFKLFDGPVARKLFAKQLVQRFGFDVEILYLARRNGYTVEEVPVTWAHNTGSKVGAGDYVYTMLEVLKVRVNDLAGRYK